MYNCFWSRTNRMIYTLVSNWQIYSEVEKFVGFRVTHPQITLSAKSYKHERDGLSYPISKQSSELEWKKYKIYVWPTWKVMKKVTFELNFLSQQSDNRRQGEGWAEEWINHFEEDLLFITYLILKKSSYVVFSLKASKANLFLFHCETTTQTLIHIK